MSLSKITIGNFYRFVNITQDTSNKKGNTVLNKGDNILVKFDVKEKGHKVKSNGTLDSEISFKNTSQYKFDAKKRSIFTKNQTLQTFGKNFSLESNDMDQYGGPFTYKNANTNSIFFKKQDLENKTGHAIIYGGKLTYKDLSIYIPIILRQKKTLSNTIQDVIGSWGIAIQKKLGRELPPPTLKVDIINLSEIKTGSEIFDKHEELIEKIVEKANEAPKRPAPPSADAVEKAQKANPPTTVKRPDGHRPAPQTPVDTQRRPASNTTGTKGPARPPQQKQANNDDLLSHNFSPPDPPQQANTGEPPRGLQPPEPPTGNDGETPRGLQPPKPPQANDGKPVQPPNTGQPLAKPIPLSTLPQQGTVLFCFGGKRTRKYKRRIRTKNKNKNKSNRRNKSKRNRNKRKYSNKRR